MRNDHCRDDAADAAAINGQDAPGRVIGITHAVLLLNP
jgi:hypothetical protein